MIYQVFNLNDDTDILQLQIKYCSIKSDALILLLEYAPTLQSHH